MTKNTFRKGDRARLVRQGDVYLVGHFAPLGMEFRVEAKRGDRVLVVDPKRLSLHCWLAADRLEKIR